MYEQVYSATQIKGDLTFLKYTIKKNQVQLIANTGLQKLIDDCELYLSLQQVTQEQIKPITVLFTLVNSLRKLWLSDIDFTIQLRAMNTGWYEYGNADPNLQHFFKDFEFEIFSASQLIKNQIQIDLPQHTAGEDLQFGDIDIQCKHPNTLNQVENNIRDFTTRLNQSNRYGVFGLAVDDCLNYAERLIFTDNNDFETYLQNKLTASEPILERIFRDNLARATRILGLYTTSTYFVLIDGNGLKLVRTTNSVFCFRPDRREISDTFYKQAYKVISTFNPQPTWLTIENQTLQSIS
ncbi:hypothetical protein [Dyadobacter tibetensis]|uniref:hypothetical protein n=1 Tax=Dyadobacter tibetensis TaxID=1211851 RepID=UPI000472801F|nr:hypothetical protein [Dyadobacter tibetensis]